MRMPRFLRTAVKVVCGLAAFAIAGIALLLGVLWLDHKRETVLPAPTGPFAVGRATYIWSDPQHADPMAPPPGAKRELLAWIWYPAAPQESSQPPADYLPPPWRLAYALQISPFITRFITRDLSRVRTHSILAANVSPKHRSYPVVFMRGGLATLATDYTSLAEDLASHGYVVVGFDVPYRSMMAVFPDGRVIARSPQNNVELFDGPQRVQLATKLAQAWSSDIAFALDQMELLNASDPSGKFLGRLDLDRVGVFGHSLGGATALQFCHDEPRCKSGIDVDGLPLGKVIQEGVAVPFLFLLSDHGGETGPEAREVTANIRSIYDRLPADRRLYLIIRGAGHYRFSDYGSMLQIPLVLGALHTAGILHLDGRRQIALTAHYISTFFDVYLKGAPVSDLENRSNYPEVAYVR
jgi:dienelactone hydrolase